MQSGVVQNIDAGAVRDDAALELVHSDVLRFFPDLVRDLGGDPDALLRRAGLDPNLFALRKPLLGYRAIALVLELAAEELACPDFGMRLAKRQGGGGVFGPIGVVMRHSRTFGEGLDYVRRHIHAHSLAARLRFEPHEERGTFVSFEILLDRLPSARQIMEQALLLAHLNAIDITGARARAREVHFRHEPLSPRKTYRANFGCELHFGSAADGLAFAERDMQAHVLEPDTDIYEIATAFIDTNFPRVSPPMHARVRGLIMRYLGVEDCTNERIADELCLHPRTLHRRLRAEGKSFEAIKDEVRRDMALRYLKETDLPLTCVAEKLGYAETSVLSRSCFRWYGAPPSRVRSRMRAAASLRDGDAFG